MVKVVETGYPTGLLVEKGNNGKTQYKLDMEQIYYWLKLSDFGFHRPLRGSNSGVRAKNSSSLVCLLTDPTS